MIVSLVVFFSRRRWGWFAIVGAYLGAWLLLDVMSAMGQLAGTA